MIEFFNSLPPVAAGALAAAIVGGVFKIGEKLLGRQKETASAGLDDASAAKAISEAAAGVVKELEERYVSLKIELEDCKRQHAEKDRLMADMKREHEKEIDDMQIEIGTLRQDIIQLQETLRLRNTI